jgi:hypothetical protein
MSPRLVLISLSAALALVFAATAASASSSDDSRDARRLEAARANVAEPVRTVRFLRPVHSYEVLGEFSVLVWETNSKAWLVDVRESPACQARALDNSLGIGLEAAFDTMNTTNGFVTGRDNLRCRITQIREVDVPKMRAAERAAAAAPAAEPQG